MKSSVSCFLSFLFIFSTLSSQNVINAYQNLQGEALCSYVDGIDNINSFTGEYQIFIDALNWGVDGNIITEENLRFKVEVVSFPFVIPHRTQIQATRTLVMPESADFSLSACDDLGWQTDFGWDEPHFVNQRFSGVFGESGKESMSELMTLVSNLFTSSTTEVTTCTSNSPRRYLPHSILKHTLYYLDCEDVVLDSISWVTDLTRGRTKNYPFANDNLMGSTAAEHDLTYRPQILSNPLGHNYGETNNDIWLDNEYPNEGYTMEGTPNYFPPSTLSGTMDPCISNYYGNFDDFDLQEAFPSTLWDYPAPFTLLDAPVLNDNASEHAGYVSCGSGGLNGTPSAGIEHNYFIDKAFDLTQINPTEKVIYNPSEVDIDIVGGGTLNFPSGYTFKTVHGRYPTLSEFNAAAADLFYEHPNEVDVPSTLGTDQAIYNIKDGSTLRIDPCVKIMDCIINIEAGGTLQYLPQFTELVNVTINNLDGDPSSITDIFPIPQIGACPCDCKKPSFYDYTDDFLLPNSITTWTPGMFSNDELKFTKDLIVPENGTLDVQGIDLKFGPNGRLIVKPGGTIIADNTNFIAACEFSYWQGIELHGNEIIYTTPYVQPPLANAQFDNNCLFQDARTAIQLFDSDNEEHSGGAHLDVQNSAFLNNAQAIHGKNGFHKEHPILNIRDNEFSVDHFLTIPGHEEFAGGNAGEAQINLMRCNIASIVDNDINIDPVLFALPDKRNAGIKTTNQRAIIHNNTIDGFREGIWGRNTSGAFSYNSVIGNTLNDNIHSLVMDNLFFARVAGNSIDVPQYPATLYYDDVTDSNYGFNNHVGIYMLSGYGNIVEENVISGNDNTALGEFEQERFTFGIVASETATTDPFPDDQGEMATSELYMNTIKNVQIALQAEGNNGEADPDPGEENFGLEIQCNDFEDVAAPNLLFDVRVVNNMIEPGNISEGSIKDQGSCDSQDEQADNQFTDLCDADTDQNFFFETYSNGEIDYSGHAPLFPNPSCANDFIDFVNNACQLGQENTCPTHLFIPDWEKFALLDGQKNAVLSVLSDIENELNDLYNNGGTVEEITSAERERNHFLQKKARLNNRLVHALMRDSTLNAIEPILLERGGNLHEVPLLAYYLEVQNYASAQIILDGMQMDSTWAASDHYLSMEIVNDARNQNQSITERALLDLEEFEQYLEDNRIQSYDSKIFLDLLGKSVYKRKPWVVGDTILGKQLQWTAENILNEVQINLWPNPAQDVLNIELIDREQEKWIRNVMLFNSIGQTISVQLHKNKKGPQNMDISSLPMGIYYLKIEDSDYKIHAKLFIKE